MTPVEGDGSTVQIHRDRPNFGAVGLFIQWLTEQVDELVAGTAMVHIELRLGYRTNYSPGDPSLKLLIVGSGTRMFKKQWSVEHLNDLHRADDGRGGLLKEEIRNVLAQIREGS